MACSEIASIAPISLAGAVIFGTTPEVERVIRRREMPMPSPSAMIDSASLDVVEIVERLAHAHEHDVGDEPAAGPRRRWAIRPSRSRAIITWPTISPAVELRTSFCVPVWQNVQFSVQPTWRETQSAPAADVGM